MFERPLYKRARQMCLALPESREKTAWGHPMFRAGSKTYCAFEIVKGRPTIAFKLSPSMARKRLRPNQFFTTPYGRGWWISIWVDGEIDWTVMADLLERSYRGVALKRMLAALDARPASNRASRDGHNVARRLRPSDP